LQLDRFATADLFLLDLPTRRAKRIEGKLKNTNALFGIRLLSGTVLILATGAYATPITPVSYHEELTAELIGSTLLQNIDQDSSASLNYTCPFGAPPATCAAVSFEASPTPSIQAFETGSSAANFGSAAEGELTYYYEILGPANDTTSIPLQLLTTMSFVFAGTQSSLGGWSQTNFGGNSNNLLTDQAQAYFGNPNVTATLTNTAYVNTIYQIQLLIMPGFITDGTLSASVDPILSFAPGFDSSPYTIVLSQGVGNGSSSSAPEPGTLLLLAVGGAALLFKRRLS
jgi:hypothetical protein